MSHRVAKALKINALLLLLLQNVSIIVAYITVLLT
jgi:hypothetical protein